MSSADTGLVRIATRGSDLALAQAKAVAARVRAELGRETELVVIKTSGDRLVDVPLAKIGGKGLFVKEIEEALLGNRADLAVHSAKDLPAKLAPGLALAAFPEREDPRDALVAREPDTTLASLPHAAKVGTGSARRAALLRAVRPDLVIVALRGNVPTRLRKLEDEGLDAIVLACAGLERLGLADRIGERLSAETVVPAVCQGTLALETRAEDPLREPIGRLADPLASQSAAAERAFLLRLEGDCNVPLAAHAVHEPGGLLHMNGLVASSDGRQLARASDDLVLSADARQAVSQAAALGERLADATLARGGREIMAALRLEAGA
jgi:hydroxymethylbilane synthase